MKEVRATIFIPSLLVQRRLRDVNDALQTIDKTSVPGRTIKIAKRLYGTDRTIEFAPGSRLPQSAPNEGLITATINGIKLKRQHAVIILVDGDVSWRDVRSIAKRTADMGANVMFIRIGAESTIPAEYPEVADLNDKNMWSDLHWLLSQ